MTPLDLTNYSLRVSPAKRCSAFTSCHAPSTNFGRNYPAGIWGRFLNHDTGFSAYVVRRLGLDMNEFRDAVGQAEAYEDAVIAWLDQNASIARELTHSTRSWRRLCTSA